MNKIMRIAFLLCFLPLLATAQTAREFFLSAPVELMGYLDKSARLDLLDYYDAGLAGDHMVKTNRDVDARVIQLTDSTFTVKVGEALILSGNTLPAKSDTVIALIETFATPTPDSKLTIYNKEWKELPKAWKAPEDKAWGKHEAKFLLTEYIIQGHRLTLTDKTEEWIKESAPAVKQLLYDWDSKSVKFKPSKK